jgi:UDP-3-O-[3-hydroxymyristoyl] glucosamine N-acyltransferase
MKLSKIAALVEGELIGKPEISVERIVGIEEARKGDITWISQPRYERWLSKTKAGCVIVSKNTDLGALNKHPAIIKVSNPSLAAVKLLREFCPGQVNSKKVSNRAYICDTSEIGKGVSIGEFCYIGENTVIGDNVCIFPNVYIGNRVSIGANSWIYPTTTILDGVIIGNNVRIYSGTVIGTEGFAYTQTEGKLTRIPHCGNVIIEDDVEIGAVSAIARSVVGNTIIKKGTKIDNLVHIAHNVVIGENSIITAQAGIAGSVKIGKNVVIAGQAGISDHIVVGNNVTIGGQAGVTKDIPSGITVCGYPASSRRKSNLAYSLLIRLPELFKRVRALEQQCKLQ